MVGIAEAADQKIVTLSGGQRRRLDVAVGIVGRPELLFLDEPTAGFDPHARREFHALVHRLADLEQTTILLTTHDLDEAEKLADRVLILAGGRIVADGSADEPRRAERRSRSRCRGRVDGETLRALDGGRDRLRARAARRARRRGRRPRGAPREPGGHLHLDWCNSHESGDRTAPDRVVQGRRADGATSDGHVMQPMRLAVPRLDRVRAEPAQRAGPVVLPSSRACSSVGYLLTSAATPRSRAPTCWCRRWPLPSILAGLLAFGVVIGPVVQRWRWRARTARCCAPRRCPHGLKGYFTSQLTLHSLGIVPQMVADHLHPELLPLRRHHGRWPRRLADGRLGDRSSGRLRRCRSGSSSARSSRARRRSARGECCRSSC